MRNLLIISYWIGIIADAMLRAMLAVLRPGRLETEVAAWGEFKADTIPVEVAGKRQAEAIKLMDRAGWR